jgi:hypothetical protein
MGAGRCIVGSQPFKYDAALQDPKLVTSLQSNASQCTLVRATCSLLLWSYGQSHIRVTRSNGTIHIQRYFDYATMDKYTVHTCLHTNEHSNMHTHIRTYMHAYIHTYIHIHTHTYTHTHTHTHIHTYIHTYICAYIQKSNTFYTGQSR